MHFDDSIFLRGQRGRVTLQFRLYSYYVADSREVSIGGNARALSLYLETSGINLNDGNSQRHLADT
jgi:hypothetical protein